MLRTPHPRLVTALTVIFLLAHIAGNATFTLLVKTARGRRFDYPLVGLTNYASAAIVSLVALLLAHLPAFDPRAALFGLVNGVQYQVTYLLMFALIGMTGIAVTTSFLRLSVAVPVLASILIWREWPAPIQTAGLALAAAALPLLSSGARRASSSDAPPALALEVSGEGVPLARTHATLPAAQQGTAPPVPAPWSALRVAALVLTTILVSGCGLLAAKAFAELDRPEQRPVYVAAVYLAATCLSAAIWPWRARFRGAPQTITRPLASVALGALVGLVNVGQIWVLLPALAQIPGVIAFPVAAAGGLSLAALGGWVFWREPLGGRTGAGILLAILAAALANTR